VTNGPQWVDCPYWPQGMKRTLTPSSPSGPPRCLQRVVRGHSDYRSQPPVGMISIMKIDTLASIAHDIADSLGSGSSLVFNRWGIDVYSDADASDDGLLEIDLLTGQITSGNASPELVDGIKHAPDVLASFCAKHGGMDPPPKIVAIKFFVERTRLGVLRRFSTVVEDHQGRQRTQDFYGSPGRRIARGKQVPATAWSYS
jgi:hypothetical protein